MKKKLLLITTILLIVCGTTFSQNVKTQYVKDIVGTWKVDSLDIGSFNLSPQYEVILREKMPEIIAQTEVIFTDNKKYFKQGFEGKTQGSWDISKDGAYILVKLDGEAKVTRTKIVKLTSDKMIMAPDDENAVNSKAYLYKVK